MQQLGNYVQNFINSQIIPLGLVAIIGGLVAVGFCFIVGFQRAKEWAKGHVFSILIGAAILYGATNIATDIVNSFKF